MSLLIAESPLQVLPSLAVAIGLNEAMMLQQMHFWLNKTRHSHKGHKVFYKSVLDWQTEFPFWSESTIKRTLYSLKKQKLIFVWTNLQKRKIGDLPDRTNWFAVNYPEVDKLEPQNRPEKEVETSEVKMTSSMGSDCTIQSGQNDLLGEVKMTQPTETTKQENTNTKEIGDSEKNPSPDYPLPVVQAGKFFTVLENRTVLLPEVGNKFKTKAKTDRSQKVVIPDWIDFNLITEFIRYREGVANDHMTGRALSRLINDLSDFQTKGYYHTVALNDAMDKGWKSAYLPNHLKSGGHYSTPKGFDLDDTSWADNLQEVI